MTQENLMISIDVLRKEVSILTSRLRPAGTGYLHTAIDVLNKRIDELIEEVTAPYWKDEDGDIGRLPGQTRASHLRSVEGANKVKDAYLYSSRVKDDVEHSPCYYDTERNKPMEGQDLPITKGLSDRSQFLRTMKQKHGQAVMTTSEMMQEELEPLPINTFE